MNGMLDPKALVRDALLVSDPTCVNREDNSPIRPWLVINKLPSPKSPTT